MYLWAMLALGLVSVVFCVARLATCKYPVFITRSKWSDVVGLTMYAAFTIWTVYMLW